MRHVDEGIIHAWLDGQITDPAETAWIEEHLRWCAACGARLAEERATLEQASALLALAAPAAEPPPFEVLVAKAGRSAGGLDSAGATDASRGHRWRLQLGWAASLALAVGIGWMARDIAEREPAPTGVATADRAGGRVPTPADPSGSPPPPVVTPAPAAPAAPAETRSAVPVAAAPQGVIDTPRREGAAAELARARPQAANAVPPSGVDVQREAARQSLEEATATAAAPIRQGLTPSAPLRPATAPEPVAERMVIAGSSAVAPVMTRTEWQTLARTEAAARSGMALYGIDGLAPTATAISADGRVVRTVYRLESGATLEMEQQRVALTTASGLAAQAAPAGPPVAAQRREAIAADAAPPAQRVWSGLKGDVRVTLRTPSAAADLEALGMKLRVD